MSTATITITGTPRIMTIWIKLGLAVTAIAAAYWGAIFF